jgi:hypothetical protein
MPATEGLINAGSTFMANALQHKEDRMAKVFGMHEIELRPDVKPEEYEQFFTQEIAHLPVFPGWKAYLLKADRGERAGKYLLMYEVESVETRDRYFPRPDEQSEEVQRFLEQHSEVAAAMQKSSAFETEPHLWSDYIVVAG